ncbi:hypothetical protein ZEAMMB73_Zm00001d003143 [Zea mays]|uniref:Uncharacterized protein n=1 Tax=Zea mays TaxID=4577 RepID=A0A1D6E6Z1_MAIZE|nr:hypothetical protein ZEAMMB73_Zm00001d003143 [Zea mays]
MPCISPSTRRAHAGSHGSCPHRRASMVGIPLLY